MFKNRLFLVVAISISAMNAYAVEEASAPKPNKPTETATKPARAISFEELKARCEHPEQFDIQRAPQNIRVQCAEQVKGFVQAPAGQFPLPKNRMVATAVLADKFFVNLEQKTTPIAQQQGSCLRFKEIIQSVNFERSVSCADLESMKGGLGDFCSSALDSAKQANEKIVQTADTGKVMDTCGGLITTGLE